MRYLSIIIMTILCVVGFIYKSVFPHAVTWYESGYEMSLTDFQLAETGDSKALFKLGEMYYANTEFTKAIEYYKMAIEKEYTPAMIKLATMYRDGIGIKQNYAEYTNLMLRASQKGDVDALKRMGKDIKNALGF